MVAKRDGLVLNFVLIFEIKNELCSLFDQAANYMQVLSDHMNQQVKTSYARGSTINIVTDLFTSQNELCLWFNC